MVSLVPHIFYRVGANAHLPERIHEISRCPTPRGCFDSSMQAAASCIPTPCFGFTTFPGHKDFHKDLSLHRKYRNPYRSLGHVSICPNRQQILGESNGTRCVTSVVGGDHKLVSSCFVYFLFLLFAFKAKKCQTHCQFLPFFGFESSKLLTATASAPQ